jgi:glycosyltransferase involved in cell wall biosynthesis
MRIGINFHTQDRYISGVEYYSLGLIDGLLRIDCQNQYVVLTNQPELVKSHVVRSENIQVINIEALKTRPKRILWEHFRLPQIAKNEGLDILHCTAYICPIFNLGTPYLVTVHDTIAIDHPLWCKWSNALYHNILMKRTARRASRVLVPSRSTADNLSRNFCLNGSKVTVVYPGIDSIFNNQINHSLQTQAKARYGLPQRYILFVGNIEPKKNILKLLQAYKLLQDKKLPHKLVLVGKRTWKCTDVWNRIRKSFAPESIVLTGYVERKDMPSIYQMADVFVFVSLCEGFGFPPLEAMACGTPVVAAATGVLKEVNDKAYCLVDPNNPYKIAEAIYSLITDRSSRQRQIELGIKESLRFKWDRAAEQTLRIYKEVARLHE